MIHNEEGMDLVMKRLALQQGINLVRKCKKVLCVCLWIFIQLAMHAVSGFWFFVSLCFVGLILFFDSIERTNKILLEKTWN